MNIYQRIQKAIDYIENNLTGKIAIDTLASVACLSMPHFYRMFHALTGHNVKEYIRRRRLYEAAIRLSTSDDKIIDICFDYQFEYQESFTRAFKNVYNVTPGVFKKSKHDIHPFPPLDLIDKYFIDGEVNTISPKIKVLKRLEPMRVASCLAVGSSPEREAYTKLSDWARQKNLLRQSNPYRIFGYNNPGPAEGSDIYGYEVFMTVDNNIEGSGDIKIKSFPGGLYAVTGTTVAGIEKAWVDFVSWLKISKYTSIDKQCLEEHLSPVDLPDNKIKIDLYLPIEENKGDRL